MTRRGHATSSRQSLILAATLLATAIVFWRPGLDVFGYPKFAALVLGISVAAAAVIQDAVVSGRLTLASGLPAWTATAFAGSATLVAVLPRPSVLEAVGGYARHTGAVFYVMSALAALLVMRAAALSESGRWRTTRTLAIGIAATGGVVAIYGLLQWVGADPLEWVRYDETVTSTFGNANFTAALLGCSAPAACWLAWDREHPIGWRVGGLSGLLGMLAVAIATGSIQGPVTAGVGVLVFVLAVILDFGTRRLRRALVSLWAAVIILGAIFGVAGLLGRGPLARLAVVANIELRSFYWSSALRMFGRQPVEGVGLDRYGAYFGQVRSDAAGHRLDLHTSVDAAHNVPLQLLATGGMLTGVTYLSFVVVTAVALVIAFRRTAGRSRLLVGAMGGAWAAAQAQSLVSIDTPPLSLLHWLSAGSIIAWSGMVESRTIQLPWASHRKADVAFRARISSAFVTVVILALATMLVRPLRADAAAAEGMALAEADRFDEALTQLDRATAIAQWEPQHWKRLGDVAARAGNLALATEAYSQLLQRNPRSVEATVTMARIAAHRGNHDSALALYERSIELEPRAPTLLREAADYFASQGRNPRAEELLRRARAIEAAT